MNKTKVVVTRRIADAALQKLWSRYEVVLYDSYYPPSREWLESNIQGADGVLCMLTERFDSELLEKTERLKVL